VRDTSGDVAIWLMSGTAILSGAIVANVSTTFPTFATFPTFPTFPVGPEFGRFGRRETVQPA
jgi:hypothetical protein